MIKSTFSLFQRVIKHLFSNALYLTQSHFNVSPKRFDTVHVRWIMDTFMTPMLHPKIPGIAHIDQVMITTPALRMKGTIQAYFAPHHLLQRAFTNIGHSFSRDPAMAFKETQYNGFTSWASASLASNAFWAKVGFVHFTLSGQLSACCSHSCAKRWRSLMSIRFTERTRIRIPVKRAVSDADRSSEKERINGRKVFSVIRERE